MEFNLVGLKDWIKTASLEDKNNLLESCARSNKFGITKVLLRSGLKVTKEAMKAALEANNYDLYTYLMLETKDPIVYADGMFYAVNHADNETINNIFQLEQERRFNEQRQCKK